MEKWNKRKKSRKSKSLENQGLNNCSVWANVFTLREQWWAVAQKEKGWYYSQMKRNLPRGWEIGKINNLKKPLHKWKKKTTQEGVSKEKKYYGKHGKRDFQKPLSLSPPSHFYLPCNMNGSNTVNSLVSDHPWCTTKWSLRGGGRLRERSTK